MPGKNKFANPSLTGAIPNSSNVVGSESLSRTFRTLSRSLLEKSIQPKFTFTPYPTQTLQTLKHNSQQHATICPK